MQKDQKSYGQDEHKEEAYGSGELSCLEYEMMLRGSEKQIGCVDGAIREVETNDDLIFNLILADDNDD